jgi:hypothetical protein
MKDVTIGPKTLIGILYKKKTIPHKKQVINANRTPLAILNKKEFFKSLKSSDTSIIPKIIRSIKKN